jgi:hypothetical protein
MPSRDTGVGARRVLDQQVYLSTKNAAFGIDLIDRQLAADLFVFAEFGIGAGQGIVEAHFDLVGGPCGEDKGCRDLC